MEPEQIREMSLMLDFYGGLLSDRQRELCEQYYGEDLSLSEIAGNTGITRQGVRDGMKKAEAILTEAEKKLGFCKAWRRRCVQVEELSSRLAALGVEDPAVHALLEALRS